MANTTAVNSSLLCPSAATLFVLPSAYSLLFLTSLPGNAVSLWVFGRCISSVSPIHVYLSHLSVSNLMLSLTTPFLAAYYARGWAWAPGGALCQLVLHAVTPVLHINVYIGLMILTWVALSRFASLIQRTHASRPSSCTTLLPHRFFACLTRTAFASRVCGGMWAAAVVGIVPVTVYYSVKEAASGGSAEAVCYNPAVEIGGGMSAAFLVPVICLFFLSYLLVLLSYMTVLRHLRNSRRSASVTASHSLLGRVFRNIVVIQVVISVCLLPYHIFRPIFIILAHNQRQEAFSPGQHCHPLSMWVELKNGLLLLAALRGSTDPLMYFLLDKTFRRQTLRLLRCDRISPGGKRTFWSVTGSATQRGGEPGEGNAATATAGSSHESVLNPTNPSCENDI